MVSSAPNGAELGHAPAGLELDVKVPRLVSHRTAPTSRASRAFKRTFDLAGSLIGLVLALPVLLVIAVAVKLDSPGPALFRQRRMGEDGRAFWILKFRSMVEGAEEQLAGLLERSDADGVFKLIDDPRITRVGRFIRRHYLDELPQLVNVLRGEMSLVGPRPLPLDEDRCIEGIDRHRLDVAPGITGPWQIRGSSRVPLRQMVRLDREYVASWSLLNDLRILALTVVSVIRGRGL
jgi:lipopolysaccharide/colanic/teichoic acid biosynthesis glycosyltransferase